jgi:hypothetical protein
MFDIFTEFNDLCRHLMPDRKGGPKQRVALNDRQIEIAARNRQRAHNRLAGAVEFWLGHLTPFERVLFGKP